MTSDSKPIKMQEHPKNIICSCGRKISFIHIQTSMKDISNGEKITCVYCNPNDFMKSDDGKIEEITEGIVIDYANLSGRESAHRAEFRKRTRERLEELVKFIKENS